MAIDAFHLKNLSGKKIRNKEFTAKENAFWKSDLLKQRRAESGVVGDVQRFVYRVVKRY